MTLTDLIFAGGIALWLLGGVTAVGCLYVLTLMGQNRSYASTRAEVEASQARHPGFRIVASPFDWEREG